ncbi:MAG: hypothetical protein JOY71_29490 [Acetobacteraceae bacterium]|nr:hypothetical protein [Acetobacteraceae bacterium]
MSVFAKPDDLDLRFLIEWIAGKDSNDKFIPDRSDDHKLPDYLDDFLIKPKKADFEDHPWMREAWQTSGADGAKRQAVHPKLLGEVIEGEIEPYARDFADEIRRTLIDPATPAEIAEALATLADVLGQTVGERTAQFIIEMFREFRLPVFVVNQIFECVAVSESGKIRPVSFARLLDVARKRRQAAMWLHSCIEARPFVHHLDAALAYLREVTAAETKAAPSEDSADTHAEPPASPPAKPSARAKRPRAVAAAVRSAPVRQGGCRLALRSPGRSAKKFVRFATVNRAGLSLKRQGPEGYLGKLRRPENKFRAVGKNPG